MKPKLEMTRAKWNTLSEDERGILRKLGISPKINKVKLRRTKRKPPKTYILSVHTLCTLCETEQIDICKMSVAYRDNIPYLQSKKLKQAQRIIPKKYQEETQPACCNCMKELCKLEKEEIVCKLTKMARNYDYGG